MEITFMATDFTWTPNHKLGTLNQECKTSVFVFQEYWVSLAVHSLLPSLFCLKWIKILPCLKARRLKGRTRPKNSALCLVNSDLRTKGGKCNSLFPSLHSSHLNWDEWRARVPPSPCRLHITCSALSQVILRDQGLPHSHYLPHQGKFCKWSYLSPACLQRHGST